MAPKGNKNGVGHGRPPEPGYSNPEVIRLGEKLLAWMKKVDDEQIPVVHLSQWYSRIQNIPKSQWRSIRLRPCFLPYYEKAIEWMGTKILENKELPTAYGSRFLGIYFKDIREHEEEIKEEEMQRNVKEFAQKEKIRLDGEKNKMVSPNQPLINQYLSQAQDTKDNEPKPETSSLDSGSPEAV